MHFLGPHGRSLDHDLRRSRDLEPAHTCGWERGPALYRHAERRRRARPRPAERAGLDETAPPCCLEAVSANLRPVPIGVRRGFWVLIAVATATAVVAAG